MNSEKLQQLKDEITEKMIIGLQSQHFGELLKKYDVLSQTHLMLELTLKLDVDESIETNGSQTTEAVNNISNQEVAPQACGWHKPCPLNPNVSMCYCCC